eukprot:m.194032 g.194032  ORF g.194032 m.194032 type:complete len:51 (+) comp15197_c0_seq3:308-460(+)
MYFCSQDCLLAEQEDILPVRDICDTFCMTTTSTRCREDATTSTAPVSRSM